MSLNSFYEEKAMKQAQQKTQKTINALCNEMKRDGMASFLETIKEQADANPMHYMEKGRLVLDALMNNDACQLLEALTGLSMEELLELNEEEGNLPGGNE